MNKFKVVFGSVEEIRSFVDIMNKYPCEMDLTRGKFIVDAKSLLGIVSLGICNEINLIVHGEAPEGLREAITTFAIA